MRPLCSRKYEVSFRSNPLSPPCIPPNPGFRDLSAKSKFLAVSSSQLSCFSCGEVSRDVMTDFGLPGHLSPGGFPTVPPSMNSALVKLCRRSFFPRAMLLVQRTTRRTMGGVSHLMCAMVGMLQAKVGSGSVQINETCLGANIPRWAR